MRPSFFSIVAIALIALSAPLNGQDRAAWMKQAKWGVMTHYLSDWIARSEKMTGGKMTVEQWNNLIDHFDVETLAKQLESAGAGYYQITFLRTQPMTAWWESSPASAPAATWSPTFTKRCISAAFF